MATHSKKGMEVNASHRVLFRTWSAIHIQCKDEEGKPYAKRKFKLELPAGDPIEGELDDDGWVKEDRILAGPCIFTLYEEVEEEEPELHFIHVQVKDEEGRVLTQEPYTLTLSDNRTREGVLDPEGWLHEEDIPPGPVFFALKRKPKMEGQIAAVEEVEDQIHHLRLQFLDDDGDPVSGRPFMLKVGGMTFDGKTNDEGRVIADVPYGNDNGDLTIWMNEDKTGDKYEWPIKISEHSS